VAFMPMIEGLPYGERVRMLIEDIVNLKLARRVALLCVAGLILANCAGTPTPLGAGYRPAPATSFMVYVRSGDTISQIAERHRVSEEDIVAMNNISNPDNILSGDQLYVPAYGVRNPPLDTAPVRSPQQARTQTSQTQRSSYQSNSSRASPRQSSGQSSPAAPSTSARFLWPVSGRVISTFGTGTNGERNDGINIVAAHGTPFRAAKAGIVTYVGNELRGFGNLLLIKHDNGFVTAYAHADRIDVTRGQRVEAGQFVGQLGATGDVSQPQLHFEIRQGTTPLNPSALLIEGQINQAILAPSDPARS
jgi:murein DD-endopeptidase MepM/ murein hydrolase activator NlpD